jgi:ribosomal protein S18 acetylase RimI-like enzyme
MNKIHKMISKEELATHLGQFASMLSRAFYKDPFYIYIMPDDEKRMMQLQWWFKILIRYTFKFGDIYYTENHNGVALWLGPEKPMADDIKVFSMGMILYPFKIGLRNFIRVLNISGQWDKEHKKMPEKHYYLMVIGVEPEFQQQGIGSRLMIEGLKKADEEDLECFLETVTKEDVRFYTKFQFETAVNKGFAEKEQFWLMKRPVIK